jgi:hypothetical protein
MFCKLPPPRRPTLPPTFNFQPSTPYLAANTLNHKRFVKLPPSTNIIQHYLPKMAILNSRNCLTPNPLNSFQRQIVFHSIQDVFLWSSLPPEEYIQNWFNRRDNRLGCFGEAKSVDRHRGWDRLKKNQPAPKK